MKSTKTWKNN